MVNFFNFLLRVACAIAFGVILMFYDNKAELVLRGAGLLFGLSGLLALVEDVIDSLRGRQTIVPFTAYGSLLAGVLMLLHSELLVAFVPAILGALLILDCANQLFNLLSLKFRTSVRFAYFIAPVIITIYGIFLLFQTHVDVLVGLSFLLFSVSEVVVTVVFFKYLYLKRRDEAVPAPEAGAVAEVAAEAAAGGAGEVAAAEAGAADGAVEAAVASATEEPASEPGRVQDR